MLKERGRKLTLRYTCYSIIFQIFLPEDYASKKISTFELNGKSTMSQNTLELLLTTGSSELKAWQGLECAEAYRHINQYVTSIKDKLGDEDIYVSKLT